jgi:hypothetical protein
LTNAAACTNVSYPETRPDSSTAACEVFYEKPATTFRRHQGVDGSKQGRHQGLVVKFYVA